MVSQSETRVPPYLRPGNIVLVFVGATVGVFCREVLTAFLPDFAGLSLAELVANVTGAFLLGCLLERLAVTKAGEQKRQQLRLLLGTGALGGFTTYSALALMMSQQWGHGNLLEAIGYGAATLMLGGAATWLGVLLAARGTPAEGALDD